MSSKEQQMTETQEKEMWRLPKPRFVHAVNTHVDTKQNGKAKINNSFLYWNAWKRQLVSQHSKLTWANLLSISCRTSFKTSRGKSSNS